MKHLSILLFGAGAIFILLAASFLAGQMQPVAAASLTQAAEDDACLVCHRVAGMTKTLPNRETLDLFIDEAAHKTSVHAEAGLKCTDCHEDITSFPHPELKAKTRREVTINMYALCHKCHAEQYNQTQDSVHFKILASGNLNAAICTDCHAPHTQKRITNPQTGQPFAEQRILTAETCGLCHSAIYEEFRASVHGRALYENNPDVPTCTTCHGVHRVQGPDNVAFVLKSPTEICGRCHTNAEMMSKYGISTNVINSYVADFHGTTAVLFEATLPEQAFNKPLCFDCHGVHNILSVKDPQHGLRIRENILITCQKCHPNANLNFSEAWLSHYDPSPKHYPIVYYVNLFYKIFIPLVLGGMSIFVLSDIFNRLVIRRKGTVSHEPK